MSKSALIKHVTEALKVAKENAKTFQAMAETADKMAKTSDDLTLVKAYLEQKDNSIKTAAEEQNKVAALDFVLRCYGRSETLA